MGQLEASQAFQLAPLRRFRCRLTVGQDAAGRVEFLGGQLRDLPQPRLGHLALFQGLILVEVEGAHPPNLVSQGDGGNAPQGEAPVVPFGVGARPHHFQIGLRSRAVINEQIRQRHFPGAVIAEQIL